MSVEVTVALTAVIKVDHDGPVEGLDKAKYDALLLGGLSNLKDSKRLHMKLNDVFHSGRDNVDLGYIDDNVSYFTTDLLDATVTSITSVEEQ